MSTSQEKIREILIDQYTLKSYARNNFESVCDHDYDEATFDHTESMVKAFERGFDNCWKILDKAIREWAKKQDMSGSRVQYQIVKDINVDEIKLLK